MGDAGSSYKESYQVQDIAAQLSGLDPNGGGAWNLFSFHAFRIVHYTSDSAEQQAMAKFKDDIEGNLLDVFARIERHKFVDPGEKANLSYHEVDVGNVRARRAAAAEAAGTIEKMMRWVGNLEIKAEDMLTTGASLETAGRAAPSNPPPSTPGAAPPAATGRYVDDPVATKMMELYLGTRLGEKGLQLAREQRTQIYYQGWVVVGDAKRQSTMKPVLFLTRSETRDLLEIATRVREYQDCTELKQYFKGLIDKIAPDDENLSISALIDKVQGIRFQSPLLQVPYSDFDSQCSVNNAEAFNELLRKFGELDQFLYSTVTDESVDPSDSRKYELTSGDFYWIPVDKLP